jgi:hypothetical protein
MNIVILLCLIIFITYVAICCILAYYFLKHRTTIWNKCFIDLTNICEYFECPIHSLFWIPNIILTRDNCSLCKQELQENATHIKQLDTLASIYKLFKQIDKTCISQNKNHTNNKNNKNNKSNKNNLLTEYEMFLWLLEGSIKDYEMIAAERSEVYYKLKDTYNTLNENHSSNSETRHIQLEHITQLEHNIELCNQINKNIKKLFLNSSEFIQVDDILSQYLLALFIDINQFIQLLNIHFNLFLE